MRLVEGRDMISAEAADLLRDESNMTGAWCGEACWPSSPGEASEFVASCARRRVGVTVSGGRTGIVGGALPDGGAVISTADMRRIGPVTAGTVEVEAGVTLEELRRRLSEESPGLFFPPDPTEATATLGGMAATDASGSDSLLYGSTRSWVESADLILPGGIPVTLKRGEYGFGPEGCCRHPVLGTLRLEALPRDPFGKDAAGYRIRREMDLLDLFLGSEGTLGLLCSLKLRLAPAPFSVLDAVLFHPDPPALWPVVRSARSAGLTLRALEVMDSSCLDLMRSDPLPGSVVPPAGASCAVMIRVGAASGPDMDGILGRIDDLASLAGIPADLVWAGFDEPGDGRMRSFRHSLPELVNREIGRLRAEFPAIHKYGSDSAVPAERAGEFYAGIRRILTERGLKHVVFGHAGQGHLHANAIPRGESEMEAADLCMEEIARAAVSMGGTVSAEHGLGRLKGHLLGIMHPPEVVSAMISLRRAIDPECLFGRAVELCQPDSTG